MGSYVLQNSSGAGQAAAAPARSIDGPELRRDLMAEIKRQTDQLAVGVLAVDEVRSAVAELDVIVKALREQEPPPTVAEEVDSLTDIEQPQFGVVYVVAGQGSYLLNAAGDQWVRIASV